MTRFEPRWHDDHFDISPNPAQWLRRVHPDAEMHSDDEELMVRWPGGGIDLSRNGNHLRLAEGESRLACSVNVVTTLSFDEHGDPYPGEEERLVAVTTTPNSQQVVFADGSVVTSTTGPGHLTERTIVDDEGVTTCPPRLAADGWEVSATCVSHNGERLASRWSADHWTRHVDDARWMDAIAEMRKVFTGVGTDDAGVPLCPR